MVNPVAVEAKFEDGRVVRYPQEIRERIVRCRDCRFYRDRGPKPRCENSVGTFIPEPDGFCAWGRERS